MLPLSITWPIHRTFIPAEQVGDLAASQVTNMFPLHPWGAGMVSALLPEHLRMRAAMM